MTVTSHYYPKPCPTATKHQSVMPTLCASSIQVAKEITSACVTRASMETVLFAMVRKKNVLIDYFRLTGETNVSGTRRRCSAKYLFRAVEIQLAGKLLSFTDVCWENFTRTFGISFCAGWTIFELGKGIFNLITCELGLG